jgi:hypothetical protein
MSESRPLWRTIGLKNSSLNQPARFESEDEMAELQQDMLELLKISGVDPARYDQLATCSAERCGADQCLEACWFGTRRRRLREISPVYSLIRQSEGPVYEVRALRSTWARPIGRLQDVSITAAKQSVRRVFDRLNMPSLVVVGTFKAYVAVESKTLEWKGEMHLIVVGAVKEKLEEALSRVGHCKNLDICVRVMPVDNLGQAISRVLRRDLQAWQHPWQPWLDCPRPTKQNRLEFYTWLLGLAPDARLGRYGCDRYFNKLAKTPRTLRPPKKRPYPYWLERRMFGNHPPNCLCRACSARQPGDDW